MPRIPSPRPTTPAAEIILRRLERIPARRAELRAEEIETIELARAEGFVDRHIGDALGITGSGVRYITQAGRK